MDTKDKKRSGEGRTAPASGRSSASRSRQTSNRSARSGSTARPKSEADAARTQQRSRRTQPAAASRKPAAASRQKSASASRQTARRPNPVRSNAPEQVFNTAQEPVKTRDPQAAKRAAQRRQSAKRAKERQIQKQKQANRPAVEYTPAKPINVNRLLLQIVVVLAVVLAIILGLSVFFKVESVVVYGNSAYSAWTVQEAAGIETGENLMTMNRTRVSGKIIASLPYVESARIGIKLPDTVNIYIEEVDVAYAARSEDGTWWLLASSGNVLEQIDAGTASNHTKILGVELSSPVVGMPAKAVETVSVETEATEAPTEGPTEAPADASAPTGETNPTEPPREVKVVTGQDKLDAALVILASLELNQIIGEAASVDVSTIDDLQLWYGQQYQVRLGDAENMDYKISCMKAAIAQQKTYDMGILDVSFTQWPDQVAFTPAGAEE